MATFYRAFGLSLCADRPVPGLKPSPPVRPVDTHLWLRSSNPPVPCLSRELRYRSETEKGEAPALQVWALAGGTHFRMTYSDGTEFIVDRGGSNVWATWPDSATVADTATYLLGPVIGFVLRLRGVTCLHASAVAAGGRAIALLGSASTGKSTTAAAFCRLGYRVLADDIAAVFERDGMAHVQPAYPQVRLWPDAVSMLFGDPDALPRLTPTWDKRALDVTGAGCSFQDQPVALAAIYQLDEQPHGGPTRIEPLARRDALLTLLAHTYVGYLLDDRMRGEEFACLSRLAATVPVRKAIRARGASAPFEVCASILEDLEPRPRGSLAEPR